RCLLWSERRSARAARRCSRWPGASSSVCGRSTTSERRQPLPPDGTNIETEVFFFSGYGRWTAEPHALRTVWRENKLVAVERVSTIRDAAEPIRLKKKLMRQLLEGSGPFAQPWNLAGQSEV